MKAYADKSAYQGKKDGDWATLQAIIANLHSPGAIESARLSLERDCRRGVYPLGWWTYGDIPNLLDEREAEIRAEWIMKGWDDHVGRIARGKA
jgi:hypothetical protein